MRLPGLRAVPDPAGHRIVLDWSAGDLPPGTGARVVRRARAFPASPEPAVPSQGVVVADTDGTGAVPVEDAGGGRRQVRDDHLVEGMHYYHVYPYSGSPAVFDLDPANRLAGAATAPFGFAAHLASLLPAVYHRFDVATPATAADADVAALTAPKHHEHGQLRRFLELPGAELDRLYSDVRSLLDLTDVNRVDGRLLPLLAAWIGWPTDHRLDYAEQRVEIRQAPAVYQSIGTVPATAAAARRITGWPSRVKEYVDNIAATNRPQRRTLWLLTPEGSDLTADERPLTLDSSPHGRPAVAAGPDGVSALVYHAWVDDSHEIRWKRRTDGSWQPSEPVAAPHPPARPETVRDPAAAQQGDATIVLWSVLARSEQTWRIDLRRHEAGAWGPVQIFGDPADGMQRRAPVAATDSDGGMWLVWQELTGGRWRLRHARFTGDPWPLDPAAGADVPGEDGQAMGAVEGLSVVARPPQAADPSDPFRRLILLWAQREPVPGEPTQTRWRALSRCKDGSDPDDPTDWTPAVALAGTNPLRNDRDPAALVAPGGQVEVVLASTRTGGWSVHRSRLNLDPLGWAAPQAITDLPSSHRWPVPLALSGAGDLDAVVVRSNRGVVHAPPAAAATATTDRRWSGSTTVRAADTAAFALRDSYEDHLTYTYDTARADADRHARDTVGLFADAGPATPEQVAVARERLRRALPDVLPATNRAVLADTGGP